MSRFTNLIYDPVRNQNMYYVYLLRSKNSMKWYTGVTENLQKRFIEHNEGRSKYTKGRGLFELIYYEACKNKEDAEAREKYLKSGMGRKYLKNRLKRFLFITG